MRKLLLTFLLATCLSVYSQNEFSDIINELNNWHQSVISNSTITNKPSKSIEFSSQKYSIDGILNKGILCDGTIAKFYDTSSLVPSLLLEGKVSYHAGRLVIEGIRYLRSSVGINKIYGTFYVYNMDDFSMNYKPKKAGNLRMKNFTTSFWEGCYRDRPAIVKLNDKSEIYLGDKTDPSGFSFLSAVIPNIVLRDDEAVDVNQILLKVKDNVMMSWADGTKFKGSVKPIPMGDSLIVFWPTIGEKTGMPMGPKKITINLENDNIVYTQCFNGVNNNLLTSETLLVKNDGTLNENEYWNSEKIYQHCYHAKWTYINGNKFEGAITVSIMPVEGTNTVSISSTATKGVFKYPNGDRFEGDISSKSVYGFFIDGTTFFADGTQTKGNWLEQYKLNNDQWQNLSKCKNPSEARELAQNIDRSNKYPEYEYSAGVEYFDPSGEQQRSLWIPLIYNKAKNRYTCIYSDNNEPTLEFAVDNKGQRKWEIVYENGKPTFINEFTWYSNGIIESIKSFSYDTKKIYLSCNFFSDGKLRSAYQYGKGNSGENILRKSKESHPSYGGYTCKLYDLNGNYERSIEWSIGIGESLFGGRYDKKMAPAHLDFDKLKPVVNYD